MIVSPEAPGGFIYYGGYMITVRIDPDTQTAHVVTDKSLSDGEGLKYWRESSGLTQQELADAVGIRRSYLSQLETRLAEKNVSLRTAYKIADYLGCYVDEVFPRSQILED